MVDWVIKLDNVSGGIFCLPEDRNDRNMNHATIQVAFAFSLEP
jgi:hypothetical protein